MHAYPRIAALAGLSALLLSGCQSSVERASCPAVTILATTAAMTMYKDGFQGDPSGELYSIEMTGVRSSCDFDRADGISDTDIDITFRARRAPTGDPGQFTAPYYVASLQGGSTILSKQALGAPFSFQPGEATTTFTVNVPSTVIHLANGVKPYEYSLIVGLQLTRAQLDDRGKSGSFAP